jgi:lambda repressor-like predicted transcriptional regulator
MQRTFTEDQDAELAGLYERGQSARQLARRFDCAISTVSGALERAGVERRPAGSDWRFDHDESRALAERYAAGESMTVLAREHGCDRGALRRAIERGGGTIRRSGPQNCDLPPDLAVQVVADWEAGMSKTAIAAKWRISTHRIRRTLDAVGLEHEHRLKARDNHCNWKGGRITVSGGYVRVLIGWRDPLSSMCDQHGYILEHRLVIARSLGRPLTSRETVHHLNGVRSDNRLENLQLRHGRHGCGQSYVCADCGSHNIVASELAAA